MSTNEAASLIKVLFCLTCQTPRQEDEILFFQRLGGEVDELGTVNDSEGPRRLVGIHLADVYILLQRVHPIAPELQAAGFPVPVRGMRHLFFAVHDRDRIVEIAAKSGVLPMQLKRVDPMGAYGDWAKVAFWRSPNGFILGTEQIENGPPPTRHQPNRLLDRVVSAGILTPNPDDEAAFLQVFGATVADSDPAAPCLNLGGIQFRLFRELPYQAELSAFDPERQDGMCHATFRVGDVDTLAGKVAGDGVTVLKPPHAATVDGKTRRLAYFRSPNGVVIGIESA